MRKHLLALAVGAALAALTATPLLAQQVVPNLWTGNECWNVGQGPGGPGGFLCLYGSRNATGYQLVNTAISGTLSPTNLVNQLLINVQPSGALNINTPTPPFDAELFSVCNVSNAAFAVQVVTLVASPGQNFSTGVTTALTTLASHNCVEIQYSLANATWYQVR